MQSSFLNRKIFGIKLYEIAMVVGMYLFFTILYNITLWINRMGYNNPEDSLFSWRNFFDDGGVQYMVLFGVTVPFWFLYFRFLKNWTIKKRLFLHLFTLPLFIFICLQLYHFVCDLLGFRYLKGSGEIWDMYIPSLFYVVQFGVFHGYHYFTENQRKLKLEGELRQAVLKSELSAIKAQLNPHFLYNVFNTINASVPSENERTRQMIAKLSDIFRYQLRASKEDLVPLGEELDFVSKYLDLEKERFGERLQVVLDVDPNLYDEKIPPMILQPLVENSVKHGLSSLIEGGKILIAIFKQDGKLKFEIADNGVGVKDTESLLNKGIGLTNTQLRLMKVYKSKMEFSNNEPSGLKIKFAI